MLYSCAGWSSLAKSLTVLILSPIRVVSIREFILGLLPEVILASPRLPSAATILLYHRLHSKPSAQTPFSVSISDFEAQLDWLCANREVITVSSLVSRLRRSEPLQNIVAITFDDGYACTFSRAWPLLLRYHLAATIFLDTERIDCGPGSLSAAQIREMAFTGMEFGSHSVTHQDLRYLDTSTLLAELTGSRDRLSDIIGHPIAGIAYPFGRYNKRVVQMARLAGYEYGCCCTGDHNNDNGSDVLRLRRVEITGYDQLDRFVRKLEGRYSLFYRTWSNITKLEVPFNKIFQKRGV